MSAFGAVLLVEKKLSLIQFVKLFALSLVEAGDKKGKRRVNIELTK